MFFDFDQFKSVNDTHGHAARDAVRKRPTWKVAQRIGEILRTMSALADSVLVISKLEFGVVGGINMERVRSADTFNCTIKTTAL